MCVGIARARARTCARPGAAGTGNTNRPVSGFTLDPLLIGRGFRLYESRLVECRLEDISDGERRQQRLHREIF